MDSFNFVRARAFVCLPRFCPERKGKGADIFQARLVAKHRNVIRASFSKYIFVSARWSGSARRAWGASDLYLSDMPLGYGIKLKNTISRLYRIQSGTSALFLENRLHIFKL